MYVVGWQPVAGAWSQTRAAGNSLVLAALSPCKFVLCASVAKGLVQLILFVTVAQEHTQLCSGLEMSWNAAAAY